MYGAGSLSKVVDFLRGDIFLEPVRSTNGWSNGESVERDLDFGEVKGQQHVKRAVEVAAAGAHNILTFGPIPPICSFESPRNALRSIIMSARIVGASIRF